MFGLIKITPRSCGNCISDLRKILKYFRPGIKSYNKNNVTEAIFISIHGLWLMEYRTTENYRTQRAPTGGSCRCKVIYSNHNCIFDEMVQCRRRRGFRSRKASICGSSIPVFLFYRSLRNVFSTPTTISHNRAVSTI